MFFCRTGYNIPCFAGISTPDLKKNQFFPAFRITGKKKQQPGFPQRELILRHDLSFAIDGPDRRDGLDGQMRESRSGSENAE